MTFKEFYDSLEKKQKRILSIVMIVCLFSFVFTTTTISFFGYKILSFEGQSLPLHMKIPELSLEDENGKLVSLAEKPRLKKLMIFFKPECPGCRMELSNVQYLSKTYPQDKLQILTISEASKEETNQFLETYAVNFSVLMDPEKTLREQLKFKGTPAFFLVDESNIIKYVRLGYKKLAFDEMIIDEFVRSSKIPVEVLGSEGNE